MMIRERDKVRSLLTENVYEVKTIKDYAVILQSLNGSSQIWTEIDNIGLFYEKVEDKEIHKDSKLPPAPKPLRNFL